jgi:putative CRISPR-associated protein (TIGR02619 family)
VFIATDNAPGRLCSRFLADIVEKQYGCDATIERIRGMQVYNSRRLRETGLKNLVKTVLDDYLANEQIRYQYDIIINPTGGYKAIVPFLTVLGMLYGRKAIYLFEHAEELIELPPLPLTFDLHLFERVREALRYIEDEVAVPPAEYFARIVDYDPAERDLFLSFTEPLEENKITLSPLTYVLLKIENNAQPILISSKAQKMLNALKGEKRTILERLITRTSNPLWREHKIHRWPNNPKILIIKDPKTAERLAGFIKKGHFHVALVFGDHNDYERELAYYTIKDFKKWEYLPWEQSVSFEEMESLPASDDQQKFIRQIEALTARVEQLKHALTTQRTDQAASSHLVDQLNSEMNQWRTAADAARAEYTELQRTYAQTQQQLADRSKTLEQLQHDHAQLMEQAQASAERIEQIEKKHDKLQVSLVSERTQVQSLQEEHRLLSDHLAATQKDYKKSQKRIQQLKQKLKDAHRDARKMDSIRSQLSDAIDRRKKIRKKLKHYRKRFDALEQTLVRSQRKVAKLRRQRKRLRKRLARHEQLKKRLAKAQKKQRKSAKKNRALLAKLATLKQQLKQQRRAKKAKKHRAPKSKK